MITILSGAKNSGKTRRVTELYSKSGGVGYCQPKVLDSEGRIIGYNVRYLETGEEKILVRTEELRPEEWNRYLTVGKDKYCINLDLFDEIVTRALKDWNESKAVFIDEIGILEINREGYWKLLEKFAAQSETKLFITVRPKLLDQLIDSLKASGTESQDITVMHL